ncbi:MAG: metallophosphoesterase [Vicinamibacterales bacterium]
MRLPFLLVAAVLGGAVALPSAQSDRDARRVVAIGDVHGSLSGLTAILQAAGLIDAQRRWTGGTATLVQTGDLTDRGAAVRGVLDLMMQLERAAPKARGKVEQVLGNHEVMNLLGELRDATPEICAAFADGDAARTRERGWRDYQDLAAARARTRPDETPPAYARTEAAWLEAYPPGCIEYRLALGPRGPYGRWLRSRPIAVQVGDSVFMHAGPNPATEVTVSELNATAKRELERFDSFLQRLVDARMARPWFRFEDILAVAAAEVRWTNGVLERAKLAGETPNLSGIDIDLVREASDILQIGTWSLLAGDGPLWYRGYATADDATLEPAVTGLLARWKVARIVVGHTPNRDYRIRARFGSVFLIDTGMLAEVYKGVPSALEISGARTTATYGDGTRIPLGAPTP